MISRSCARWQRREERLIYGGDPDSEYGEDSESSQTENDETLLTGQEAGERETPPTKWEQLSSSTKKCLGDQPVVPSFPHVNVHATGFV
eukprot:s2670_g7.t1